MITAFARMMEPVPTTTVPAALLAELLASKATLERELRQRSATIATLRRELTRAIEAPSVVGERVVDGMLTIVLSTGAVVQRRPRVIDTPDEFVYGYAWQTLAPVPGTRAEIVDAAFAGDANVPDHYRTAQRRIAETRTLGMAVVAGDPS